MKRAILLIPCLNSVANSLSISDPPCQLHNLGDGIISRRDLIVSSPALIAAAPFAAQAAIDSRAITTLRLNSPNEQVGVKLKQATIGTPPRNVVVVDAVLPNTLASRAGIQEGLVVVDYDNPMQVITTIKNGPFPLEIKFYNLAAGGDAFGDLGKPLVTAKDALELAKSTSSSESSGSTDNQEQYVLRVLAKPSSCQLQSRRGDVLEINYEARIQSPQGLVYDTSTQRGTGLPYQMVLGSGDMIPGVDRGLYDMCPGEIRALEIPPVLGYGPRASKTFGIPSGSRLYWTIELVSVNSVREGDERDREELEGRAAY